MYKEKLEKHIVKIIKKKNIKSYDDIFKHSKGAFPDLVYPLVLRIDSGSLFKKKYYGLREVNNIIPESNPSNYDWRFDKITSKKLVELIKHRKYKRIALFGTPSLFIQLCRYIKDITLFDINELLKSHFDNDKRIIIDDINTVDFKNIDSFDCIIMDPPWYLDYYQVWLQKGNNLLKMKGEIYITLFQELLRPKAQNERTKIINTARKIGSIKLTENYIQYITPLFEKELFNFKNIPCYDNWRTADLLIIKKET
ncbi:MAG TPA: hypothetical protein VJY62_16595, partial [Bacteroidia bacterium]|nr:hypothetical protein [Bacteroidia bacterium]